MLARLLLNQHIGVAAEPLVKVGTKVEKGQLIAVPNGLGANLHASISGYIKEVNAKEIVIEGPDLQPEEYVHLNTAQDPLKIIQDAGIVGAGGAGFPTHVKLKADLSTGCVIANASECEPTLKHNIAWLKERPEIVVQGLKHVMAITGAAKGFIAIKPKHKQALIAVAKAIRGEPKLEIRFLPDLYPAGDERVIVRELLGVELAPGELPLKAGAVVCNVETLKNIARAIEEGRPVISKDLTLGGRLKEARTGRVFFDVPLGLPIKELITCCGGIEEPHGEIVLGGAFTGKRGEEDAPVTKTLGGVSVTMPFLQEKRKMGLLACECGASKSRLEEIAASMGATVAVAANCKRMEDIGGGRLRCNKPGVCPGQAESVLALMKGGAEALLIGTCQH
ncbi:MAG: proline reductase-associated electron transfer protein PrdC [Firmicutes bacterium]|nr:proline reductase-associated electron transfer protein PrdC [Bacillota bacterium]